MILTCDIFENVTTKRELKMRFQTPQIQIYGLKAHKSSFVKLRQVKLFVIFSGTMGFIWNSNIVKNYN